MIPELFSNGCFYSMYSQIKFCSGKKNAISVYVFCFMMTLHQDHLLRKKGMSCDACRSFAFPVMLEETLDKPCYLQSAKKQRILFYCKLHAYKLHHWKCCLFFLCSFCFFTNVRSGLPLEDVGFRNMWRCDSALAWIACYLIDVRQLHDWHVLLV